MTDSNGQTVNYTYDESKRVTGVETTADGKAYRNAYTYENDRIKTVAHNTTGDTPDVTYTFNYDELGRKTTVKVGSQTLSTNVYASDRSGLLKEVQYGNDGKVKYAYDEYDRLTGVRYDDETTDRYTYEYGADGEASVVRNNNLGRVLQTERDLTQRAMGTQLRDTNGDLLYRTELDYDTQNRLVGFGETASGQNYKTAYTYDNDNRVTEISFGGNDTVHYTYDNLGRVSNRVVENGTDEGKLTSTYEYVEGGYGDGSTTPLVSSIQQNGISFSYTYDNRGNIVSETRNGQTTSYAYDALGQLIRVNDPHLNQTWVYNYDRGGNILSRVRYAYNTGMLGAALETIPYTYGDANWKDKLTAYDGKNITYDAIGNPLNDDTWSYEWQTGRQLKRMSAEGKALTFQYDHNGLRTQKIVEADWYPETTNYYLHGKLLTHMTVDYRDTSEAAHQDVMHFFYDAQSRPAKVSYNGTIYTYVHNLQGDVVGLLDNSGTLVVEYKYDVWGKAISTTGSLAATLGKRNPFRYRGYVYDEETGLYYLRSRYYIPEWNRFINADNYLFANLKLLLQSVYSYCRNNPSTYTDVNGYSASSVLNDIADFFKRIGAIIKSEIAYDKFGSGTWKYEKKTKVKTSSTVEEVINQMVGLGSSVVSGYLTTLLSSSPVVGAFVGGIQYTANELGKKYATLTIPNIPDGVYTIESASYTEKHTGPFGIDSLGYTYNKTYYYLYGYDVSGCEYYAVWEESYIVGFGIMDASSWVLAQRTQ